MPPTPRPKGSELDELKAADQAGVKLSRFREAALGPGDRHVRAFERAGWHVARKQGSHTILCKDGARATLSIPRHAGRDVPRALIHNLLKLAGLSVQEYRKLYR